MGEDHRVIRRRQAEFAHVHRIAPRLTQTLGDVRRQGVVHEEPHGPFIRGSTRCLTDSAAYWSVSRRSSGSRSGYASRISSGVIPSAVMLTTVATGIRKPRRQGTPPVCAGLTVIRVNFMAGPGIEPHLRLSIS